MARHTFEIDYNGSKANIEFEDDIPYGKFSDILKKSVNLDSVLSGNIKIDIPEYISLVLQNCITSAPFNPNKEELSKLGRKLYSKIVKEVLAYYPLGDSLESWATAMLGDEEQVKSMIKSMPSVLSNSAGTSQQ